jgi:methylenetetrahydrofolate reductase (NADPH)
MIEKAFEKGVVYSLEVFPPKPTADIDAVFSAINQMRGLAPDFISVTYGASGGGGARTLEVARHIKAQEMTPLAHITCIGAAKDDVARTLDALQEAGISDILALRGDRGDDVENGDFRYAVDLIAFIRERHPDMHIAAACYPEAHPESGGRREDIGYLKEKVDAGAGHLITQLFFDNELYYDFVDRARAAGIAVPIEAGIMPVTNARQIERIVTLCGASLPRKFVRAIARYRDNAAAMRDCGIAYAGEQILDLLAGGADGIHLYTMNNAHVAGRITQMVRSALAATRGEE